jgi:hypothetical protein
MLGDIPSHIGSKLGKKTPDISENSTHEDSEHVEDSPSIIPISSTDTKEELLLPKEEHRDAASGKKRMKKRSPKRMKKKVDQPSIDHDPKVMSSAEPTILKLVPNEEASVDVDRTDREESVDPNIESLEKQSLSLEPRSLNNSASDQFEEIEKTDDQVNIPEPKLKNIIAQKDMTVNKSKPEIKEKAVSKKAAPKKTKPAVEKSTPTVSQKNQELDGSKKERQEFIGNLRKETSDYLEKLKKEREARSEEMARFRENLRKELSSQVASIRDNETKRQKKSKE